MRQGLWILRVLLSHWRRNPLQLAALVAGLMIATALWSGVQAMNAQARASYDRAAGLLGQDVADRLVPRDAMPVGQEVHVALRRAGWKVSPVLEGEVTIGDRDWRLIGVEPLTLSDGPDFFSAPWAMLAGPETLEQLGLRPGERPETASGRRLPELVAAPDLIPGVLMVDIGAAQAILGEPGRISYLLLDPEAAKPAIGWHEVVGDRLRVVEADGEGDLSRLTDSFHLNLTAFGFLAFVVGLFIVHAAIGLAFEQRLGMVRTLRACGVSARRMTALLLVELLALALVAGLAGVVLGYGIAAALLPDVAASLRGLYGAPVSGSLTLAPQWWLTGVGMSLVGALVAAGHTLARAWSMPVLASARRQAWKASQERALRWQTGLAALLLAAAGLLWVFGGGLVAGFAIMAGMLLGAALLLPVVLAGLLWLASHAVRGPLAEWAVADSRQQLSGLSLALMALLLALSANVGVGTMVEGFRTTFGTWLDGRLAAEVYYDAADDAQVAGVADWLAQRPEVREVLPVRSVPAEILGWPSTIHGRTDAATYREEWPLIAALPQAWDRVARGEAALVSEQLARRADLWTGDRLTLPTPDGPWEVTVAGVYADYGNPRGQVSVDLGELTSRWPRTERSGTGVRVAPEKIAPLMEAMRTEFDFGPSDLIDQRALKALSNEIFEKTFAVTGMLNVLTLGVAGVALFASLATLADLRLPQLAPLWATGVTRRQLAALELGKTLALALLTGVLAIPLGLGVAWLLVSVVNVEAFGWRLPLHLFPGQWAWLLLLTAVTAVLASALPVLRLRRVAPARLVKIFAEER
jgi:putative ABC transport system permease protein